MKRIHLFLIAFTLLSFLGSYGQENYINGFIVNNQNDTVNGLLKNNSSFVSSQVCVFREDIKSRAKKFFPSELKMYKENEGRVFFSKTILISDKPEKVFLELLLDGIVDLYYYRDLTMNEYYFVDKGDGILDLLKNEKYTITRDGIMYEKYTREFEKVLYKAFEKSDTIKARVKKVDIERESLINISKDYHKEVCPNDECIVYQKIKKESTLAFGLSASYSLLNFQKIRTVSSDNSFMYGSDFGYISVPGIGIFLSSDLPNLGDRFRFNYYLSYSRYSFSDRTYINSNSSSSVYISDINVTHNCLDNRILLNYNLSFRNIKPVILLGPFCNIMFSADYERKTELVNKYGDIVSSLTITDYEFSGNAAMAIDFGICGGIGLNGKMRSGRFFFANVMYQYGSGLFYGMNSSYYSIMLGMQINKPNKK